MSVVLTPWTIWAVIVCYAVAIWIWLGIASRQPLPRRLQWLWLLAAVLLLAHALFAFDGFYHWSHVTALEKTAEQTAELTGWQRGEGLYLNYGLVVAWLVDAAWMMGSPVSYRRRPAWLGWLFHGFVVFMLVNGAIVFAPGPVRWAAVGLAGLLVIRAFDVGRRKVNSDTN